MLLSFILKILKRLANFRDFGLELVKDMRVFKDGVSVVEVNAYRNQVNCGFYYGILIH